MKMKSTLASAILVTTGLLVTPAFSQTKPVDPRLQKLKAQREAAIAAAKARQNAINRPAPTATPTTAPTPTVAPTVAPVATPTTAPTTRPTATPTATPTTTPTAAPTTTPTARATGAGGAPATTPTTTGGAPATTATPSASALPKPPAVLGLDLEELKKTRPDRRKAEVGQLQSRWGELLRDARAADELKLHAQRTAYLQRIRALASKAGDAKTVQAVDILITKEDTRNANAMNALRSGALLAPVAGAAK